MQMFLKVIFSHRPPCQQSPLPSDLATCQQNSLEIPQEERIHDQPNCRCLNRLANPSPAAAFYKAPLPPHWWGSSETHPPREQPTLRHPQNAAPRPAEKSKSFPDKFLWGCATAGHQVEGNNTNSDLWTLEHLPQTIFKEPSGDACDHYHLYPQDISMLAGSWLQHLSLFPRVGAH